MLLSFPTAFSLSLPLSMCVCVCANKYSLSVEDTLTHTYTHPQWRVRSQMSTLELLWLQMNVNTLVELFWPYGCGPNTVNNDSDKDGSGC